MAISINRPVTGSQLPVTRAAAQAFAEKSAAAKVAQGWKETVKDLPSEAVDKFKRAAHAIAHPIDTLEQKWDELKANPKKVLLPLAMMAGGVALTAISPGLMRAVGVGMTASMFVIPSVKFAKSKSEDELMAVADGTSKQLVDTAASYATSWAIGKVVRASLQKYQERKATVGAGPDVVGKGDVDQLRMKGDAPVAKGMPTPDEINHSAINNNADLSRKVGASVRDQVSEFYFQEISKQNPGMTREAFDAFLKTAEGKSLRTQMVQNMRGVVHSQMLQLQGVKVTDDLAIKEMAGLRKYMRDFTSNYDMADAVKGINAGLEKGLREAAPLNFEAERFLYTERGVTQPYFTKFEKAGLDADGLKTVRKFADSYATSQSGKYLKGAAQTVVSADVNAIRGGITRQLLTDVGYIVPKSDKLNDSTLLSLLRDLRDEEPKNAKQIIASVNEALRGGETNYYKLNEIANRKVLSNLGLDDAALKALDLSDEALKAAQPNWPVNLTRAEQIRLLRDRLRALPEANRLEAIASLKTGNATLLTFDNVLASNLEGQIAKLTGANQDLVARMTRGMTEQQRTNFVTDLSRLPEDIRKTTFANLTGSADQMNKTVVDRLTGLVQDQFEVNVHREAGKFPIENWGDDEMVKDWSVQGATQLHNSLNKMATNGQLPTDLRGTTYVSLGAEQAAGVAKEARVTATADQFRPYYRPGSGAYQGGTMGYRTGMDGKDLIVLFDDAMKMPNTDEAVGVTLAEGTLIHESGHAIQLGGKVGTSKMDQMVAEQKLVKEWSSLSDWREADGSLADGYVTVNGQARRYYKDPSVQVGQRSLVVSDYGATDTVEDFAEFTRLFYNDPATAMEISPEKFLYMNQMYENHYNPDQTTAIAQTIGIGADGISKAIDAMRGKLAGIPGDALAKPGVVQKLKNAFGIKTA